MIWLLFAHFIGDIALQAPWQAENKGRYWYVMLSHCVIWTACVSVALEYLGLFSLTKVAFLIAGHWLMDLWKSKQPKTPETWWMIYPDQFVHFVQLVIVYLV